MPVAGNIIVELWTILDLNSSPLTGMLSPGDITFTLHRQSGTVMVAASETISFLEIGSTGNYSVAFTPANTGLYVLQLKELNANTLQRTYRFPDFLVTAAGATFVPSYANAYCAETDVERYLLQSIDSTTKPNDVQVAGWAQGRADVLESLCAGLGVTITPSTVVAGSRMEGLLREANAIGAALDATIAQVFATGASKTDKAENLLQQWDRYYGGYIGGKWQPGIIAMEISQNSLSLATNHTLSGDTVPRDNSNPPQDVGSQITMGDVY